jgi:hypothetical protein
MYIKAEAPETEIPKSVPTLTLKLPHPSRHHKKVANQKHDSS